MSYHRRTPDTSTVAGAGELGRRWLALVLIFVSLASAHLVLGRDVEWNERRREARRLGVTAEQNGNYPAARRYYETALANHPYDWVSHLALADVLNYRLGDYDDAVRHYLYALAYSPEPAIIEPTRRKLAVLRLIRSGELEDPRDALADMFAAAESDAPLSFAHRIAEDLRGDAARYREAWRRRGPAEVRFVRVLGERDGFYDATVEMHFAVEDITLSMHLQCPLRDIWRVNLSFP